MTHFIPASPEQIKEINEDKRINFIGKFKKTPRIGDDILFQSEDMEVKVTLTQVYDGSMVNSKFSLVSWRKDSVPFEFQEVIDTPLVITGKDAEPILFEPKAETQS